MKFQTTYLMAGAAGVLGILALGGALALTIGLVPIKASPGHWSITTAILEFAKERAVWTQSLTAPDLELEESWLVLKGAGHYESGCKPCHGSPGRPMPAIPAAMTPRPPELGARSKQYDDRELFFIVKHGIKFTGMPAWPAEGREDEVAAMVAFLRAYPDLDAAEYHLLAFGPGATTPPPPLLGLEASGEPPGLILTSCVRCHGEHGQGRGLGAAPKLAGQKREYLLAALDAYSQGTRQSGIMRPVAVGMTADEKRLTADYYSGLTLVDEAAAPLGAPEWDARRGEVIATSGVPETGLPSCRDCHGPPASGRNPQYPRLAGQYAEYLVLQLELFKRGSRGGAAYAHIMRHVAARLGEQEMRDVAAYYASVPRDSR